MQRDESDDGRRSLESCCPEDVAVACRHLRESDPRPRGPQSPVEPIRRSLLHPSRAAPDSPKSGFLDGAGVGAAAGGVVQFLDNLVDVSVVVLGSLVGTVQFLDKAADVPVAVPPVVFKVFSQDGFSSVLLSRPSSRTGARC